MRIGIDARLWNETGVGRYIRNVVLNLSEIDKKNSYVLFVKSSDKEEVESKVNKEWKIVSTNSKWHSVSEQYNFPKTLKKEKLDLMHFPYFSIPVFYRGPFVVTIHDLILHHFATGKSSTLPLWAYGFKMLGYKFVINLAAARAKKIIAVSNFTKEDVFENLRVNKRKVEVIYEGVDDFDGASNEKVEYRNYFLYVGNVYPHKNAERLTKAFDKLAKEMDIRLVFVGKEDIFYQNFRKQFKNLEKDGKIIFEYGVSDKRLAALYNNSIGLVRPSLMEGFSLPPLEAFKSGTLSIVSDIPVHREILGDLPIYFNPKDEENIASELKHAANLSEKQRKEKIDLGKKKASEFSWKKAALETLKIYESSLSIRQGK